MSSPIWRPSRRDLLRSAGLGAVGAAIPATLAGCGGESVTSGGASELKFMYWGSTKEKTAIEQMLGQFEESHDGVTTKPLFTPSDYETKLNTLVASDREPDVAYLGGATAFRLAESGQLLNLYDYIDKYPELGDRLPSSYFWYGEDKLLGTQTANEVQLLWYNRKVFDDAGVETPPAEAASAWTWDQFLETAHKLTLDQNGNSADQDGFDPSKIRQYGCSFGPVSWLNSEAMVLSRGSSFFNEDGTQCLFDSEEVVQTFQDIADLAYKYHVAPTATQLGNNAPSSTVQLQTRRIAMVADGQWILLDLGLSDLDYGVGVLPKYDEPFTIAQGGATSIFASTQDKELAVELYLYHNDPTQVDLFSNGLWMPLGKKYYTEPEAIDLWTDNDVHPPEYRTAAVDYTLNHSARTWTASMKNSDAISEVMTPALQQIDQGKKTAAEVCKELAPKINERLEGRYPQQEL